MPAPKPGYEAFRCRVPKGRGVRDSRTGMCLDVGPPRRRRTRFWCAVVAGDLSRHVHENAAPAVAHEASGFVPLNADLQPAAGGTSRLTSPLMLSA
ncbi:MAG: hypothetical protein QOH90_1351 [Actinomycetota bacterium]|nr:hypothetical protein [Actinomycetota bacterium]